MVSVSAVNDCRRHCQRGGHPWTAYLVHLNAIEVCLMLARIGSKAVVDRDESHHTGHEISELFNDGFQHWYNRLESSTKVILKISNNTHEGKTEKGIIAAKSSDKSDADVNARSHDKRVKDEEEARRSDQTVLVRTHSG